MGRWRPPPESSSPYITAEGAIALERELKQLWRQLRPEVVRALAAAAAEGDRSENAEYIYRKKQLGEIDRRVRYLSKRLDVLKVIDRIPEKQDVVRFGAWVDLEASDGALTRYRIVGPDETNATEGWISVDSPVAKSLIGKSLGDDIAVTLPDTHKQWSIARISFNKPADAFSP